MRTIFWSLLAALLPGWAALAAEAAPGAALAHEGKWEMPPLISTYGDKVDHIFVVILIVTGIFAILVLAILAGLCLLYRAREGHRATYTHGNSKGALALSAAVGALVFLSVDLNAVKASNAAAREIQQNYPKDEDAVHIRILAQQFNWNVHHPGKDGKFGKTSPADYQSDNPVGLDYDDKDAADDKVATSVTVPVDKPIIFELTSKDVLHSFFIPYARVKQDVVPGMTTRMWVQFTKTGEFEIACAELCGLGHYKMRAVLKVLPQDEYDKWVGK